MKTKLVIVCILLNLLIACSTSQEAIDIAVRQTIDAQTPSVRIVEQEVTREVEITRIVTATPRPIPKATKTPTAPEMGTKDNPHPFGETVPLIKGGKLIFTLTIIEILRGDAAFDRILQANQFNDPPPEGFEFVLIHVEINYTGSDQGILQVEKNQFAIVTKGRVISYSDTYVYSPCCIEPDLELSLFQGGIGDGWIALPVAIDDPNPILAAGLKADGSGGVFFSLIP